MCDVDIHTVVDDSADAATRARHGHVFRHCAKFEFTRLTMTNAVVQKTKHIEESYVLQYGTPVLANGVGWDAWSARVNVCAERMVVVFEACNETGRRDDAGVGLLRWRQGTWMLCCCVALLLCCGTRGTRLGRRARV